MRNDDQTPKDNLSEPAGSNPPNHELEVLKRNLRWAQESQILAVRILELLNRQTEASDAMREILGMVKEFTGFEAVGIRLRDGEDFPYFETIGFPGYFVEAESSLCSRNEAGEIIRDSTGNPLLECMCGNILRGRTDPSLPFFTQGGSFWSNCTTELLATTTEKERQTRTRNQCNGEGYESVALIPLRSGPEIIGLLQLNDSRKNCFTPEMISFFEGVGVSIGIVLDRTKVERERDRLFNLSIDMLCIAGFDGFFKQVNPAFTKTLGWTKEELLTMPGIELVQPEDREATVATGGQLESGQPLYEFRNRCRHKDGSYRWVSWNMFPIPQEGLIYAVGRDVTKRKEYELALSNARDELEKRVEERTADLKEANEKLLLEFSQRKQVEEALRTEREQLLLLFESINEVIQVIDVNTYKILYANKAAKNLYGRELLGGSCYKEIHGLEKPCAHCPKGTVIRLRGEPYQWDYHNPTTNRDFIATDRIIKWIDGRDAKFHLAVDITERKRAEEELRESEKRFRDLADMLPQFVYEANQEGFFTFANQAALETTGYTWEDIRKGTHLLEIIAPEDSEGAAQDLVKILGGEKIIGREYLIKTRDNDFFPVISYSNPIERNGTVVGFRGVAVDLTERKRAEEALRKSEERYRSLFENMLEGYAYCRMFYEDGKAQDFVYLDVNDSFERLTGLNNVIGKKVTDVIPGIRESNPEVFEIYGRVALTGKPEKFETYVDVLGIWFSISVYRSEREHFVAVFDNITNRKLAEEQVKRAEEFLNTVVDNLPVPVFAKSAQSGQFILWNKASETLFGFAKEQVIGKTDYDFFPREQADFFWKKDSESFVSGETLDIPEEPVLTKTLGTRVLHTRKVPVYAKDGQASYLLGISQDITERKEAEDSLRHLSDFQQALIDSIPNPVFYKDAEGKYLGCNEAFAAVVGLSKEQVVGRSVYEVISRDVADIWSARDREIIDHPHVQSYDFNFMAADGVERFFMNRKAPFFAIDGGLAGIIGVMVDITDRRRAEDALRESEARVRMKLDSILLPEGDISTLELADVIDTPRVQALMDYFFTLTKIPVGIIDLEGRVLVATGWQEICTKFHRRHPETREHCIESDTMLSGGVEQGGFKLYRCKNNMWDVATPILVGGKHLGNIFTGQFLFDDEEPDYEAFRSQARRYGFDEEQYLAALEKAPRWSRATVEAVMTFYTKLADILSTLGYSNIKLARTIAERERLMNSLQESEDLYRILVDNVGVGISLIDANHNIIMSNATIARGIGKPADEFRGKKCFRTFEKRDAVCSHCPGVRAMSTGEPAESEREVVKEDGTRVSVRISAFPVLGQDGEATGFIELVEDLTERKLAEQEKESLRAQLLQAQKMEAIGTLAGGIAHDFNNLLTVILGFSELLLIGKDGRDPYYADIQKINQAARNGAELVQRMLAFSRKTEINPRPLNLNHEIKQVRKLLTRTIPKMIEVELALSDKILAVHADATQLEQILMNLAVNARDAMPDGGKLTIATQQVTLDEGHSRLHLGEKPGDYVLLSVSDTGSGMDTRTLNHIFEPFYTTKELGRGTGLGLAMVYGIVKQHGGHISCESELGQGTTFKIYLPVIPSEAELENPSDRQAVPGGAETVLLVDDEEIIRDLGKRILERSGYTVLTAVNGKEALSLYEKESAKIALVILDLIMPEMGGKQCLDGLLKIDPHVKVLIASGYSADGPAEGGIEPVARGFVGKPYNITDLLRTVRKVLDEG
ncbi:MAG: PAS domain S-box protein [Desulfomonile tiedjei]|nr:PAS domain S-box protein [Desulfomonile tiedjei]